MNWPLGLLGALGGVFEMRTREEQVESACQQIVQSSGWANLEGWVRGCILEAEARGAEEQRRKDAEGQEPIGWLVNQKGVDAPFFTKNIHATKSQFITGLTHLYSQPANVAALEARVKELEEAADNLVIAIGMGWDLEGVAKIARAALTREGGV